MAKATKKAYRAAAEAYLRGDSETARRLYAEARDRHGVGRKAKAMARRKFEAAVGMCARKSQRAALAAERSARLAASVEAFDPSI